MTLIDPAAAAQASVWSSAAAVSSDGGTTPPPLQSDPVTPVVPEAPEGTFSGVDEAKLQDALEATPSDQPTPASDAAEQTPPPPTAQELQQVVANSDPVSLTEFSSTYLGPDGVKVAELSQLPINAKVDGVWEPISTTVKLDLNLTGFGGGSDSI